jgi:hypothetical protein
MMTRGREALTPWGGSWGIVISWPGPPPGPPAIMAGISAVSRMVRFGIRIPGAGHGLMASLSTAPSPPTRPDLLPARVLLSGAAIGPAAPSCLRRLARGRPEQASPCAGACVRVDRGKRVPWPVTAGAFREQSYTVRLLSGP